MTKKRGDIGTGKRATPATWDETLNEAQRATREALAVDEANAFDAETRDLPLNRADPVPFVLPCDQRPQFYPERLHGTILSPDPRRNATDEKGQPKLEGYEQDGHVFDAHGVYLHTLPHGDVNDVHRAEAPAFRQERAEAVPLTGTPPPLHRRKRIWPTRFAYDLGLHFRCIQRQLEAEELPTASSIKHVVMALQVICEVGATMLKSGSAYDMAPLGLARPTLRRGRPRSWSAEFKQEFLDAFRRWKVKYPHWDDQRVLERVLLRFGQERNPTTLKRARDMVASFRAETPNADATARHQEQRSTARRLLGKGLSKNAIAKQIGVHRRTVDRLLTDPPHPRKTRSPKK